MAISALGNAGFSAINNHSQAPSKNAEPETSFDAEFAAVNGQKAQGIKTPGDKKPTFLENLGLVSKAEPTRAKKPTMAEFKSQLADIRRKGRVLQSHPLPNLVKDYLGEVKTFLTDISDHAYSSQSSDNGVFERVEIADSKLDQMADEFLQDNQDDLKIVASLGELEGLLVDIFV